MKSNWENVNSSLQDYYDQHAAEYQLNFINEIEEKPFDRGFLEQFMRELPPQATILDAGCGAAAQQARFFRDQGVKVTAIDSSLECIRLARECYPGIEFHVMNMLNMTFKSQSFDAVNAFYSIIHIPNEHLAQLFQEFNRILKPKGKLSISVHAGNFYGFNQVNERQRIFYRTFSTETLELLVLEHGFKILKVKIRQPIYIDEFSSERIYLIAEKE